MKIFYNIKVRNSKSGGINSLDLFCNNGNIIVIMIFAVIETGGKQYIVKAGDKILIEKLPGVRPLSDIEFDKVLLGVNGDEVKIGTPYLNSIKVKGEWLQDKRGKKKIVFRYHAKTRHRKKKGHRQEYSEALIKEIKF
jgi:large subunit ribosomal protein L21